ncbi:methylation-associated defense system protein kinase MAD6 [Streptomyces sp. CCM_MD2014]|uniref:methylation-associated defense system protein kinase MAD6 n=1 Tax=Streptomyces sp. CCM_MD2014 TaxID=1561022 RepID=UPI000776285A|nr:protein kinase [Streptomyces sp. CCM_MD2014]
MARIIPIGEPANEAERMVLRHLREQAPDDWIVVSNFELPYGPGRPVFEVDLAIVADHAVYLADTKGVHGRVQVRGGRWYPRGAPFPSPARKIRNHARVAGDLLARSRAAGARLGSVWCEGLVILPYQGATLSDPDGRDEVSTHHLDDLIAFLRRHRPPGHERRPGGGDISALRENIARVFQAETRPPSGPRRFGHYEVVETLYEASPADLADQNGDPARRVSVYRVRLADQPRSGTRILQAHAVDPLLPEAARSTAYARIGNPVQALSKLPSSPYIVPCETSFPLDEDDGYAVVLKDVPAEALRVRLDARGPGALGADARRRVVDGVLGGLAVAHAHNVVHRHLGPDTVLVGRNGTAMLTGFDYAHPGPPRPRDESRGIEAYAHQSPSYLAPECHVRPGTFSRATDLYAAGVLFHELYAGEEPALGAGGVPLDSLDDVDRMDPTLKSVVRDLLAADPAARPSAGEVIRRLAGADRGRARTQSRRGRHEESGAFDWDDPHSYTDLPEGFRLTEKFRVRAPLGHGQFGVVYRVFNTLDDTDEVVKIITRDRESVRARLESEYRVLRRIAPHPNLVRLIDAEFLPRGEFPYLRMEYVEGQDLKRVLDQGRPLGPADVRKLLDDCLAGLAHLHAGGVFHCDIKPSNLLWTADGARILDFNAAVSTDSTLTPTLGSPRYLAPEATALTRPGREELTDLDLFALGVSAYEALTGGYPWPGRGTPPRGGQPLDPRRLPGLADLDPDFTAVLLRAVAPRRHERYRDADAFRAALSAVREVRLVPPAPDPEEAAPVTSAETGADRAGANPFVGHLQTLYSQNARTNAGTRGLDPDAYPLYVATALDDRLRPDVLAGRHRLVLITGNAGDGKTAFLQHLADEARRRGALFGEARANGDDFTLDGRSFHTNHDGSQDEGDTDNDTVLDTFLASYRGADAAAWPDDVSRLVAVNEGRLVDFVTRHQEHYPLLAATVGEALTTGSTAHGVAVVNLNARDVLADPDGTGSIMHRMVAALTDERHWQACGSCALAPRCYAPHNARTFSHPTAGPQVTERLATLFRMAHLRGRLHITLRDLRSALAYTLTSGRDCAQIHTLYGREDPGAAQEILDSLYFTSWTGTHTGGGVDTPRDAATGASGSRSGPGPADAPRPDERDRLLTQLRDLDVAAVPDPQLDRKLDYTGPAAGHALVSFDQRGDLDERLLTDAFTALPRTHQADRAQISAHRAYLAAARRRFYFESLDDTRWRRLLPYQAADRFLRLLAGGQPGPEELTRLVEAVSRGEGMPRGLDPDSGQDLALQVRAVPGGTVRSHRLFPAGQFTIGVAGPPASRYVETGPRELVVRHRPEDGRAHRAQLTVRLDLYELLDRLHRGHQPGVEDRQGQNLALAVFKNALAATSYQEVLLNAPGSPPYRLRRLPDGALCLAPATRPENPSNPNPNPDSDPEPGTDPEGAR